MKNVKNIIVHHNDLDGCVSAALLIKEFNKTKEMYSLIPVMYLGNREYHHKMLEELIKAHFSPTLENRVFILDFPWHPMAAVWIDHHKTNGEFAPAHAKKYLLGLDSAAEAVAIYLSDTYKNYQESVNATWAIEWTGKIDQARYGTPSEYFKCDNPWLILRLWTDHDKQANRTARIAELLAQYDMDAEIVVEIMGGAKKSVEKFQSEINGTEKAMMVNNGVGIISTRHRNDFPRYAEYIVRPDIDFSIRITNTEHGKKEIRVGRNIWKPKSNVNIGDIMSRVFPDNGGGHHNIGGAVIDEVECNEALDKIWSKLVA